MFRQMAKSCEIFSEKGFQICAGSPMTFGRDSSDVVFSQPIGPNKGCQIGAGSPMTFGRDVFDLVFAQPIGPRNNHLNQHLPTRNC